MSSPRPVVAVAGRRRGRTSRFSLQSIRAHGNSPLLPGAAVPVLHQITTCTGLSPVVIERRVRARPVAGRPAGDLPAPPVADGQLDRVAQHRGVGGQYSTVTDYRPYATIAQPHADLWLQPLAANGPEDHDGDLAAAPRAGYELLTTSREPPGVAIAGTCGADCRGDRRQVPRPRWRGRPNERSTRGHGH